MQIIGSRLCLDGPMCVQKPIQINILSLKIKTDRSVTISQLRKRSFASTGISPKIYKSKIYYINILTYYKL